MVLVGSTALFIQRFQNTAPVQRCYVLREGEVETHLVFEDGKSDTPVTVIERRNGKDVEPPSTGPGRVEGNTLTLVDGTSLDFDDTQLVWPEGSLLAGSVFVSSECPAF